MFISYILARHPADDRAALHARHCGLHHDRSHGWPACPVDLPGIAQRIVQRGNDARLASPMTPTISTTVRNSAKPPSSTAARCTPMCDDQPCAPAGHPKRARRVISDDASNRSTLCRLRVLARHCRPYHVGRQRNVEWGSSHYCYLSDLFGRERKRWAQAHSTTLLKCSVGLGHQCHPSDRISLQQRPTEDPFVAIRRKSLEVLSHP